MSNYNNIFVSEAILERRRLIKLQKEYEQGTLNKNDLSNDDIDKLLDLYSEQNTELKRDIKNYKIKIKNNLQELKKQVNRK